MDPLQLRREVERKQQELWEQLLFKLHAVVKKEAIKFVEFLCGLNVHDLQQSSNENVEKQVAQVVANSRTIVKICKETCDVFVSLSQKESERLGLALDEVKVSFLALSNYPLIRFLIYFPFLLVTDRIASLTRRGNN